MSVLRTYLFALALLGTIEPLAAAQDIDALALCGSTHLSRSDAIAACTAVIESTSEPTSRRAIAYSNRGDHYRVSGDFERSLADHNEAVRLAPDSPVELVNRGMTRTDSGDYRGGLDDLNRALAIDASFARAYSVRGVAYFGLSDLPRAIADYTRSIELNPSEIQTYQNRALAFEALGDLRSAYRDFDRIALLTPYRPSTHNSRCWLRARIGEDLNAARLACDRAIELSPRSAAYWDSRAFLALKQRRFDEAWTDYDTAVRLGPGVAHFLFGRGLAALRLGRRAEGQQDIAAAESIDDTIAATYRSYGVRP